MLVGALVYGIKYTIPEYICTFLVAGGVSSFALLKVRQTLLNLFGFDFFFILYFLYLGFTFECLTATDNK